MRGRALVVALAILPCGCISESDEEFMALLAVLDAVAEALPDSVSVCVSNRYIEHADSVVPLELQQRLVREGWHLYDPMTGQEATGRRPVPPSPGESMVVFGRPRIEGDTWLVPALYTETDRQEEYVSWAAVRATRRVKCSTGGCAVLEVVGDGHGDGGMEAARYDAIERPSCGPSEKEVR